MVKPLLLQAFEGANKSVPVWFMRQAGRFLPEYRVLREKYPLEEMFTTPELAARVTCLPLKLLDVDGAILFADILTLPSHMGFEISYPHHGGPQINNSLDGTQDIDRLHDFEDIPHIRKILQLLQEQIPSETALIGFAGSPFTVLCYLVEGGSSQKWQKTLSFAQDHCEDYHRLMQLLTKNTIRYLNLQKDGGIQIYQLFDTWAGILSSNQYEEWVYPYVQQILKDVDLPSIYYAKNSAHLLSQLGQLEVDFLSVCSAVNITNNKILLESNKGIQGNLDHEFVYSDYLTLEQEINHLLHVAQDYQRYIFSLSHGILPDTEVEKIKFIIEKVHAFPWAGHGERQ